MNPGADLLALAAALLARRGRGAVAVCALAPGDDLAERLAARLGDTARVFSHPLPAAFAETTQRHVTLGPFDEDQESPRPAVWPCSGLAARARFRKLDTEYSGDPVALIVLTDPAQAIPVLQGAAQTLAMAKLAVLLQRAGTSVSDSGPLLRTIMPAHAWFDCGAMSLCALPRGELLPPLQAAAPATDISVRFDTQLCSTGFHAPEPGAPHGGRWTGAGLDTRFVMPWPAAGEWRLRLSVTDWGNAATGFPAVVEGIRLAPQQIDQTGVTYALPPLATPTGSTLTVTLLPPRPIADQHRWPRKIGLRIRAATLVRQATVVRQATLVRQD
jgi:hypothetical protein